MHIFHFVKGEENLNSRSKMAHLPLRFSVFHIFLRFSLLFRIKHNFLGGRLALSIFYDKFKQGCKAGSSFFLDF